MIAATSTYTRAYNRGSTIVVCVIVSFFAAACSTTAEFTPENLQGIPQGLTPDNRKLIAKNELHDVLQVADDLQLRYEKARDDNLRYAFWSNVAFVPLAAIAAGAIAFDAHKDLFAATGIAAGSLAGLNVFVNARGNAKVYQSGINGLDCVRTRLGRYAGQSTSALQSAADDLDSKLLEARRQLVIDQSFKFNTATEVAEITANPLAVTNLAASERILAQAILDGEKALTDARTELTLFGDLPSFAADAIRQVNVIVASKITQTDISFSTLQSSITALTKVPAPPAKPPAPTPADAAQLRPPSTPLFDATAKSIAAAQAVSMRASSLSAQVSQFGLAAQERALVECIKAI